LKNGFVVFCGHSSLRCGDIVHLIRAWGNNPKNSLIITENEFQSTLAIEPYLPLAMKYFNSFFVLKKIHIIIIFYRVHFTPIDSRISFQEANTLIESIVPRHLVLPSNYLGSKQEGNISSSSLNSIIPFEGLTITPYSHGHIQVIPLRVYFLFNFSFQYSNKINKIK